jgi:hypothetical protein
MAALWSAAKRFGAGSTYLICRDRNDKVLSVSIYTENEEAEALARWIEAFEQNEAAQANPGRSKETP